MTAEQNKIKSPRNILVIRNDKLGDFMLAWPAIALLKKQYPACRLTVLVPEYTRPIAEQCSWIDHIILDKRHDSLIADVNNLAKKIKEGDFDVSISLFSELRTALALWRARVPRRIAPATKIAQFFYTNTLKQRRSRSEKPEYEYNIDLIRYLITLNGENPITPRAPPFLVFDNDLINNIRNNYRKEHHIDEKSKLVIIHPGSGGSAINLSTNQFAELAHFIAKKLNTYIIITCGPNELEYASELSGLISDIPHSIYHSTAGLVEFSKFIAISDIFISGSTGPLHIAGALNIATVAFYPARRSATPLRWETVNESNKRLAFKPEKYTGKTDMQTIEIEDCADSIITLIEKT